MRRYIIQQELVSRFRIRGTTVVVVDKKTTGNFVKFDEI